MSSSSHPGCVALAAIAGWAIVASAQQPRPVFSDQILPVYSRARVLNVIGRNFRSDTPLKWRWAYSNPAPTEWLQCFVGIHNAPQGGRWYLSVFDSDEGGSEIERLGPSDFERRVAPAVRAQQQLILPRGLVEGPVDEAWTSLVSGSHLRLELYAETDVGMMSVQVERCNYEFSQAVPKAIVGDDDRQDLVQTFGRQHRYYGWSQSIAFILFQKLQGDDTNCTGFLVTPTILVTNHHCISDRRQLRTSVVQFGFESRPLAPPVRVRLKELLYSNDGLDFTLLRLVAAPPGVVPARMDDTPPHEKQQLVLIQHPERQPKTIAVKNCVVQAPDVVGAKIGVKTDFYHACDSAGGSSGSPILDEATGAVVGLHHLALFDAKIMDYHNLGVRVREILQALQTERRDLFDEITSAQQRLPRPPR